MTYQQIKDILKRRIELDLNDELNLQDCWDKLENILSEDISLTISFVLNECTDCEFFWLSEVFEDVARKTKSSDFVSAITQRLNNIHVDDYNQNKLDDEFIRENIDFETYVKSIKKEIEFAQCAIQVDMTQL